MNISGMSITSKPIGSTRRSSGSALVVSRNAVSNTRRKSNVPKSPVMHKRGNNEADGAAAKSVTRAKKWTPQVEEFFRLQQCGFKDIHEYLKVYEEPSRWDNGFLKCTRVKSTGFFTYWQRDAECEDKYVNRVKVYEY